MGEKVVIIGGGIVGSATAYYLSRDQSIKPDQVVLLEAGDISGGASGKAGGFLAKDWHSSASESIAELSFRLHAELAKEHDGYSKWLYAPTTSVAVTPEIEEAKDWMAEGRSRSSIARSKKKGANLPPWIVSEKVEEAHLVGDHSTTAQVDPYLLTRFFAQDASSRGVSVHENKEVVQMDSAKKELICADGSRFHYTKILLAAGPWSGVLWSKMSPRSKGIPVSSMAGHSLILRSPREVAACHAVFASHTAFAPEFFSRLNGDIYFAGLNAELPLPTRTSDIVPLDEELKTLATVAKTLLGDDIKIVRNQLCYRPITNKPLLLAKLHEDVVVCTGAGPWGITLGPACGKCSAELLLNGRVTSADVSQLGL